MPKLPPVENFVRNSIKSVFKKQSFLDDSSIQIKASHVMTFLRYFEKMDANSSFSSAQVFEFAKNLIENDHPIQFGRDSFASIFEYLIFSNRITSKTSDYTNLNYIMAKGMQALKRMTKFQISQKKAPPILDYMTKNLSTSDRATLSFCVASALRHKSLMAVQRNNIVFTKNKMQISLYKIKVILPSHSGKLVLRCNIKNCRLPHCIIHKYRNNFIASLPISDSKISTLLSKMNKNLTTHSFRRTAALSVKKSIGTKFLKNAKNLDSRALNCCFCWAPSSKMFEYYSEDAALFGPSSIWTSWVHLWSDLALVRINDALNYSRFDNNNTIIH